MRKWILTIVLAGLLILPAPVAAQQQITIRSMDVSLWPEYDRAEMLVIYHIEVNAASFPVGMEFRIPAGASLHTIAIGNSPELVTDQGLDFTTQLDDEWLVVSVNVTGPAIQFEYYDPALTTSGTKRSYAFEWLGNYDVENMVVVFQQPFDSEQFTSTLTLQDDGIHADQMQYYFSNVGPVTAGERFSFQMSYEKFSEALSVSRLEVQPVAPVDENTPGRVTLNNSLPYIIGGLGVVMILGGLAYFLRAGRSNSKRTRTRSHSPRDDGQGESDSYCPQCGARAKRGDRFCRTCGARLRPQEE